MQPFPARCHFTGVGGPWPGLCSQTPGLRVSRFPCPPRGPSHLCRPVSLLPAGAGVAGELTRAPSSRWNWMGMNTQLGNYINGRMQRDPSLSAPWDRQPTVAEAVGWEAWAHVSAPHPHRCHLGQVSPPHWELSRGQKARPAGPPAGERVRCPRWLPAALGLGSHPSLCTAAEPAAGLPCDLRDLPERPCRGPRWLTTPGKSEVSGSPQQSRAL